MDHDSSALRHRLTVAPFAPFAFDVFVRTDSGTVEHYWSNGEQVLFGPETIEGSFTSEPTAAWVHEQTGSHLHLVGRSGATLVDWRWDGSTGPGRLGQPTVTPLPGFAVNDPVVVRDTSALQVFATRLDSVVRRWVLTSDGWLGPEAVASGSRELAVVRRSEGVLDVFSTGGDLLRWTNDGPVWRSETRPGAGSFGPPAAASYAPDRLDVFATRSDGQPVHWGWNGQRWFDEEVVVALTFGLTSAVAATEDLRLVSFGSERLNLFARTTAGELAEWTLQAPTHWSGPNVLGRDVRSFDAWSAQDDQVEVLTRQRDGSFVHWFFENHPEQGMGEPVAGSWADTLLVPTEPEPAPTDPVPVPGPPDVLLFRPSDLVLLGVRWSGFELLTGPPAELVAGPDAELVVLFPPQHVAEEVVPAAGPAAPGLPLETTDGIPTWRAALAGTSRVVVTVAAGEQIALTAEGVLDAVRRGRLVPGVGVADGKTALELPYGLLISPHTTDAADIGLTHPAVPAAATDGSVGVWQTTVAVAGAAAGRPAGLALRALTARTLDPFELPLRRGARGRIVLEPATARIDRLMLSTLGGSLTAVGAWEGFAWEHDVVLGRDRRVRTATEGVLYPFGHRAEFVEVTERVFTSGAEGAVAHLRRATSLRVLEPLRVEDPDDPHAAFPFDEVEIERTLYEGISADWTTKDFPTPEAEGLEMAQAQADFEASQIFEQLFGDMVGGGGDITEELAAGNAEGADDLFDPEDPEAGTRQSAAARYLHMLVFAQHFEEQLAALGDAATVTADLFFVPRRSPDAPPLDVPVRLGGRVGDVHVTTPVVFVADVRLRNTLLTDAYSALTDPAVLRQVAEAYRTVGDGVVDTSGARVDLVRSEEPKPGDVFEVQRLHLAGELHGGGFRPRLGAAVANDEGAVPAPGRWAFETVLPSVRALLGRDQPLQFAYRRPFLEGAPDGGVPFQVPEEAAALVTDFARDSSRSGGIVAPDVVADGLSREHGPVNVAGILDSVDGALDPAKLLADGATLLGFPLADLIDGDRLGAPPAILSGLSSAGSPVVTLTWARVPLRTDTGPFVTNPASTLDLVVEIGAAGQQITCTVDDIALALPDRDETLKVIEVTIRRVVFTQRGGQAPDLSLEGVGTEFFGVLKLLKDLQEAVDLGGSTAQVTATPGGIAASYTLPVPDVATGVFRLTGLVFHGGIDVPFDERPVTLALGFASREKPFNLSVLMFGGGGYVDILIDRTGLRRLELALEFGASVAVNFVIATGEVHAFGGIRMLKEGDRFALAGYLRFGGSVTVLGLIEVSIEVTVELTYDDSSNEMSGRATLVLEIDLTFISESVEIDTGRWVIAGGEGGADRRADRAVPGGDRRGAMLDEWHRYRSAFADEPVG
jgi:hypothetical protein